MKAAPARLVWENENVAHGGEGAGAVSCTPSTFYMDFKDNEHFFLLPRTHFSSVPSLLWVGGLFWKQLVPHWQRGFPLAQSAQYTDWLHIGHHFKHGSLLIMGITYIAVGGDVCLCNMISNPYVQNPKGNTSCRGVKVELSLLAARPRVFVVMSSLSVLHEDVQWKIFPRGR